MELSPGPESVTPRPAPLRRPPDRSLRAWLGSHAALRAILLAAALAHAASFLVAHRSLQPHYLDRSVDVRQNSAATLSTDPLHYYGRFAQFLIDSGRYASPDGPVTSHMPGTSILLAGSKLLCGHLGAYGLAQALMLLVAAAVFGIRTRTVFDPAAVNLGVAVFLLHPAVLYLSWTVNSDASFMAFQALSLAFLLSRRLTAGHGAAAGLFMACGTYFREIGLIVGAGAALGLAIENPREWRRAATFAGVFALALAPWALRNASVMGFPSPGTTKAPAVFYLSSLGLTIDDLNPLDPSEGGAIDYPALRQKKAQALAARGLPPDARVPSSFLVREGVRNYLENPFVQARSMALRLGNLLRPSVALRHTRRMLPAPLDLLAYAGIVVLHAVLVFPGLALVFIRRFPAALPLRLMLAGTVLTSLILWAEPRYLLPFYPPALVLALDAWTKWLKRA